MKILKIKRITFIYILVLSPVYMYGYIDPGSLNVIWQFFAAILIGLVTAFSFMRTNLKHFLKQNLMMKHF